MKRIAIAFATALLSWSGIGQTTFSGRIAVISSWEHNKTSGSSTLAETFPTFFQWTHTSGTNVLQMDSVAVSTAALTNNQTAVLALNSVANGFGDTISFNRVKFIAASAPTNNTDDIVIGGLTAAAFKFLNTTNDAMLVKPGGFVMIAAPREEGFLVGATPNVKLYNATGTNTYYLYIGGTD